MPTILDEARVNDSAAAPSNAGLLHEPFHSLLSAAVLAPSGDNTQPWRFEVDEEASTITVCIDETRDTSPMNAGQTMARIACGAAIENIERTARHNGWDAATEYFDDAAGLATITISGESFGTGSIEPVVQNRHTNRRPYDGRRPSTTLIEELRAVEAADGTRLEWITDREKLRYYADVIGACDALMFGQEQFFRAFLANVRFDLAPGVIAREGLPVSSLELSAAERWLLPAMANIPSRLLRSWPLRRAFRNKARKLVRSSSGLCVVRTQAEDGRSNIAVGCTLQRAWLKLAERGIYGQPMMSLPVLMNAVRFQGIRPDLQHVIAEIRSDIAEGDDKFPAPAAILRFGFGRPALVRAGRRGCRTDGSPFVSTGNENQIERKDYAPL